MAVILSPRGNEASNMMKRFVRYEEAAQYFGIDRYLLWQNRRSISLGQRHLRQHIPRWIP